MTLTEIEGRVLGLFRRCAMAGNESPVSLAEPLGGLGIIPLRIIEFALAFEREYHPALPPEFWRESRRLTLAELARIAFGPQAGADRPAAPDRPASPRFRGGGPQPSAHRGLRAALAGIVRKTINHIYRRETFIVLSFDLKNRAIPSPQIAEELTIRPLTPDDASQFIELWHDKRAMKTKRFRQRMADGYIGTGTWSGDRLIGVNWLTGVRDFDYLTGLWIRLAAGACYALDLQEHEDFRGRRIGLATLAQSLREARRLGYVLQYICVNEQNERMLAGAKYLLGYKKVGEIKTVYWFGRPRSRWDVDGRRGRGRTLVLGE